METPLENPVHVGHHRGWDVYYHPDTDYWSGSKDRASVSGSYRNYVIREIDKRCAAAERKKLRTELQPCKFRLWDESKSEESEVEVTSFSSKGLGLKRDGKVSFIERNYGNPQTYIMVIPESVDTRRLHAAVKALHRAQDSLRQFKEGLLVKVNLPNSYSFGAGDHFPAEGSLRIAINEASKR